MRVNSKQQNLINLGNLEDSIGIIEKNGGDTSVLKEEYRLRSSFIENSQGRIIK